MRVCRPSAWCVITDVTCRRESVKKSLSDLGVQQLDLLLMHWPDAWVPDTDKQRDDSVTLEETW